MLQYNRAVQGARLSLLSALAAALGTVACGGLARDAPLTIQPGLTRAQTIDALHDRAYCRPDGPPRVRELYPACNRPGAEYGQSWIAVEFRHDQLVRIQRFEHYDDDSLAVERWNDLVRRHGDLGDASQHAREEMVRLRGLPDGTRSWFAFPRAGGSVLVGVYLLAPARPGEANVLEEVIPADMTPTTGADN